MPRKIIISGRFTEEEAQMIKEKSRQWGISRSELIRREALRDTLIEQKLIKEKIDGLEKKLDQRLKQHTQEMERAMVKFLRMLGG